MGGDVIQGAEFAGAGAFKDIEALGPGIQASVDFSGAHGPKGVAGAVEQGHQFRIFH